MSRTLRISAIAVLVALGLTTCSIAFAAGDMLHATISETTPPQEPSWYREQANTKSDSLQLIQQRAQVRAEQRNSRMASMQWYGMSNSRPQANATPFTGRYSPVWEMPGGRPYAWYPQARPGYVMYWR